jgi:hypothetical protein
VGFIWQIAGQLMADFYGKNGLDDSTSGIQGYFQIFQTNQNITGLYDVHTTFIHPRHYYNNVDI